MLFLQNYFMCFLFLSQSFHPLLSAVVQKNQEDGDGGEERL